MAVQSFVLTMESPARRRVDDRDAKKLGNMDDVFNIVTWERDPFYNPLPFEMQVKSELRVDLKCVIGDSGSSRCKFGIIAKRSEREGFLLADWLYDRTIYSSE